MNKFEIRTEKKKQAIIQAALFLFSTSGYSNVRVEDIAREAHVSKVSLFSYFSTKEGVLEECIRVVMENTLKKARAILGEPLPFDQKLLKALELCQLESNDTLNNIVSNEIKHGNKHIETITQKINQQKQEIYEEFIQFGIRNNEIQSNVTKQSIVQFLALINNSTVSDAQLDSFIHILLFGILVSNTN